MRSDTKLTRLHDFLQTLMGWDGGHLYAFNVGGEEYTDPDELEDDIDDLGRQDASKLRLSQALVGLGDTMLYRYDFGDNWEHTIELEAISEPVPGERYPLCLDGARSAPPEDCGGIGGYANLLEVLANPEDEEYEELKRWVGPRYDPEKFNAEITNIALPRRVVVKIAGG